MATPQNETHYVALDLGSDSMSAYVAGGRSLKSEPVPLQEHATKYIQNPELLRNADGHLSPRLRTMVRLRVGVPARVLPGPHAGVRFFVCHGDSVRFDDAEAAKSVFVHFSEPNSNSDAMPNPKLAFQMGAIEAVPECTIIGTTEKVRFQPSELVSHLTAQIINNLIMTAAPLRHVDPKNLHLVLTVPNVYSPIHIKQLRETIEPNVPSATLQTVYESDALAYYLLDPHADARTCAFRDNVMRLEKKDAIRVLTLDIGRGTTDVSLVSICSAADGQRQTHTVLGRTGVCSGGQGLTYIFVEHFNRTLIETARAMKCELVFNFLTWADQARAEQRDANRELEAYIESIKPRIDEHYAFEPTSEHAKRVEKLSQALHLKSGAGAETTRFRQAIQDVFLLPSDLRRRLPDLVKGIEDYVKVNVNDMVDYLEQMTQEREAAQVEGLSPAAEVFDDVFVIVGGQASLFKPIRAAVARRFSTMMDYVHFLDGEDAKTACARGAVAFARSRSLELNPHEVFGSYGFLDATRGVGKSAFVPVNTAELMRLEKTTVSGMRQSEHHLVYVVRPVSRASDTGLESANGAALYDGFTASLTQLTPKGPSLLVEHDPRTHTLRVGRIIGPDSGVVTVDAISTHGHSDESLNRKIWPAVTRESRT